MNARLLAIVVARVTLAGWLILIALVAVASLVANPGPFVLLTFVIAASPLSLVMRRRPWVHFLWVAVVAAALPVLLLATYGSDDGGVSGARDITVFALAMTMLGYGFACIGYAPRPDRLGARVSGSAMSTRDIATPPALPL